MSVPTIEEARHWLSETARLFGGNTGKAAKVLLASEAQAQAALRELLEAVKPFVAHFQRYGGEFHDSPDSSFAQPLSQPLGSWRVLAALYEKHNKEKNDALLV